MKTATPWGRAGRGARFPRRRMAWTAIVTVMTMLLSLFPQVAGLPIPTASAHNLDSGFVYMFFDPATQAAFDARIASSPPGTPLLQNDDTVGIVIKVVPSDGTNTGVGGYVDFYVPNGVQVTDVGYLVPNGSGGYDKAPMKGQSPIAIGDGPVGTNCTPALGTPPPLTLGPNIIGTTAQAVATTTGCHNGTIAGVYADTGIFFSTDPRTAHGTYGGGALKNNSGDTVGARTYIGTVPNLWDAQQLAAYGIAGSANPAFPTSPIVDPNGRGNAPWGNANAVAGPQSGYAWEFDMGVCGTTANPCDPTEMKTASSKVGPWQRIQYPGSQISKDQPGLKSTLLGYAGVDGSKVGWPLASFGAVGPTTPLTPTVAQDDTASPKAIRWAIGQLTYLKPEYVWVQFKVLDRTELTKADNGCPIFYGDTFGGDAGGTDSGKDHIWRYYDPNGVQWNACLGGGKPDNVPAVKVGDIYQYKIKVYNYGLTGLSNVLVSDMLPSGVAFISAVPAQNLGPNPLKWNVGAIPAGGKFEATVTVKATGTGVLTNALIITSGQGSQTIYEQTPSGAIPILTQSKSVSPTAVAPGATVTYTIVSKNIGTGPTASPIKITEFLPSGFTYTGLTSVTVNGASYTGTTVVNPTNPNQPIFTVPTSIQAGKELRLVFTATASLFPGAYCNSYQLLEGSTPYTTGALACVAIGGNAVSDFIWRDWNGDGVQDPGEEGIAGVQVCANPGNICATTDANGKYLISGLVDGAYTVTVTNPPAGYPSTYDLDGTGTPNTTAISLSGNTVRTDVDFGYQPRGDGAIGDKVFEDIGNDGYFDAGADFGIANVTVWLYEDTDGDGVITAGVDALVATTQSGGNGDYSFSGLGEGYDYLVKVDTSAPDIQTYFDTKYGSSTPYVISTAEFTASPNLSGSDLDNDFGFWRALPGSIGDQVFIDNNADGVYDAGETVLPNVTVSLYQDANGNGVLDAGEPLLQTTATDANGQYLFSDLGPGSYIVDVDQNDPDLPGGLTATKDPIAATLLAGQNKTDVDFPFVSVLTKSVDKAVANPGDTLTFTINPYYPGPQLLSSVLIQDTVPYGTAFLGAGQGGQLSPYTAQPAVAGSVTITTTGQAIYSIATNTPQYRTWDGSTFGAQTASVNLVDVPNILLGAASPTRNEKIVVDIIANNPEVQSMLWNGTSWTRLPIPPATTTAGALANLASNTRTLWGGAVAYEQLSGDAMLIWNNTVTAGTNQLTWNVWNGTSWSTNTTIATTGEPRQMRLAARPNSDEMVLVTSDASAYDRVRVWSGSAWSAPQDLDIASGGSQTAIGVAYEQQSGDALVVYGKAVATDVKLYYRIYSGGTWGPEQSLDPTVLGVTTGPQWVSIAADPNDDDIAVGVVTSGGKTWLAAWDGSAWGDPELATATAATTAAPNVAVGFETLSGLAGAAYGVSGLTTVAFRTWTPETGWSEEATGPDIGATPNAIAVSPSPNSDRLILSTNDSTSKAKYTLWDGNAWGEPFVASTTTGGTANQPVLFLWDRQQPPSSTNNLAASPTTVLDGGAITVQMTLRATKRVTGVTPGALTVTNLTGNTASVTCGSPTPASQTVPANVPTTFTWTCTASSAATAAEFSFSAGASGAYAGVPGGAYTFAAAESNSVQLLALGDRGTVTWDLGANTAAEDGVGADPGAALCPVTVTLYPTADTYIDSGNATNWFGAATTVVTRPAKKHALFKFDVSSLAGKTIQSAVFGLDVQTASASNHYDQIYRVKTAWAEGTSATNGATWNDPNGTGTTGRWAGGTVFSAADYDGTTLYGVIGPEIQNFYEYGDVTALVKDWTKTVSPVANNGLALISAGSDRNDGKYYTSEATGTTTDPVLIVTYLQSTVGGCGTVNTTLTALADTYVDAANSAVNYGQVTTFWTQPAAANSREHSLLWFNLGQIPPGATINSATLSVNVATARATNHVDEVHVMTRPWYEAAASWNDNDATGAGDWAAGTFGSGDYNAASLGTITPSTTGVKTLTGAALVSAINDWVNNGVTNRGFALISTGTDTSDAKYRSREDGTAGNRPTLTVNWTLAVNPGPSTLVSFSAAPMLTTPGAIKVTMTASSTSAGTITDVTAPSPLGIAGENGVSAACVVATLVSADDDISSTSDPVVYEWTCTATAGAVPGSVTFSGKPTGMGGVFNTAKSNSVLVTPPLTYQATVNNPAVVDVARNTAFIQAKEPDVQLTPDVCYAVADSIDNAASDNDILVSWNRNTGAFANVGAGMGTTHAEAAAWNLAQTVLYTTNRDATVAAGSDRFGAINATTGVYTAIGRLVSTANPLEGALGNFTVLDVDGMSFDPITGKLYAVHRREDTPKVNTLLDVLFQINPATGFHVEDAYGAGVDYVVLRTDLLPTKLYDVDDIAFNPLSGDLYGIANDSIAGVGESDRLVKINKATGALTDIGRITNAAGGAGVDDMEGLSFLGDGTLYGVTGNTPDSPNDNSLWRIDPATAVATKISAFPSHGDYEALACQDGEVQPGDTVIPPTASNTTETALTASIGDYVWTDLNGDGVQDPDELPLAGVQVCATNGTDTYCDTTDSSGLYRIFGLGAGAWTVNLDLGSTPAGYQPTTPTSLSVTLAANQQYSDADFGLRPPGAASIGDTVWLDANANGSVDATESGLPFVTVQLYKDTNNNGVIDAGDVLFATTTTDADGKYLFSGLYGGDYLVAVDPNSPVTSPYGSDSTLGAAMSLVSGTNPHDVTLSDGQAYTTADFGYNWSGAIGDYVWWDADAEGDQDEGVPVVGAVVLLYVDVDNNGLLEPWKGDYQIGIDFTDASGGYLFDNLPPGNYLVDVYEDSLVTGGVRDVVPTTPDVRAVSLAAGQDIDTADFGYYQGARVEGNVFWDADRNGIFDGGESGLTPVTVTLTGTDMFGAPITKTVETDASGHFVFIVPEGNYTLTYDMLDVAAIDPSLGDQTTPVTYTFHAYPGEDWHPSFDFGVDNTGVIGDTVWNDANNNGSQDPGEPGLAGVTVMLYQDNNNDNVLDAGDDFLAAAVTDANGKYLFEGLPDGNYVVVVNAATAPADFGQTYDNVGPLDGTGQADITGGVPVDTVDFGYRYAPVVPAALYTIGGRVYEDLQPNGNDDGETGFAGVDVTVVCQLGSAPATTYVVPTDANGDWAVAGIAGGSICTVLDADESDLPRTDYVATETPGTPITVNSDTGGLDFGYYKTPGSISGTVCLGGSNGLCDDPGELPLADAVVALTWAGADGILGTGDDITYPTQTTLADGAYNFTALQPGLYSLTQTNPAGYASLDDADGGNPDNITIFSLGLGQNLPGQDFIEAVPVLLMDKDTSTPTVVAGEQATYQVVVRNTGSSVATAVTISDTLPTGFTYASTTSAAVISATRAITVNPVAGATTPAWGAWDIAAGGAVTLTFVADVSAGTTPGTYDNTAYARASNHALIDDLGAQALDGDTLPADTPETDEDVTVEGLPVLLMDKDTNTPTVVAGGQATYQIVVRNSGATVATAVTISDTLPSGFSYASTIGAAVSSATRTSTVDPALGATTPAWGNWSINAGGAVTLTFVANVSAGVTPGTYDNTAYARASNHALIDDDGLQAGDPGALPGDTPETDEDVTVLGLPALKLDKDTSTPIVVAGEQATYQIVVRNSGGSVATAVTISDTLPAGFSYASTIGAAVSSATRTSTVDPALGATTPAWGNWSINAGGAVTLTFVADVSAGVTPGTYDNTAYARASNHALVDDLGVQAGDSDTLPTDTPETDEDVTILARPALLMDKDTSTPTVEAGGQATYQIVVHNSGGSVATAVTISDTLPTGFSYASTTSAAVSSATRTSTVDPALGATTPAWGNWSINAGGAVTLTFVANVSAGVTPARYDNTAYARAANHALVDDVGTLARDTDTLPGDTPETDEDVTVVRPGIAVVKAGPAVSYVGATARYTYTVTNTGGVALHNVTVMDDVCGGGTRISGDTNTNSLLDLTEIWIFVCDHVAQAGDPDPLMNIATARGLSPLGVQVTATDDWSADLVTFHIGDTVWLDADNDGVQDPGEQGLYNVPVTVSGTDVDGVAITPITVYTDLNGKYLVDLAKPGVYTVTTEPVFAGFQLAWPSTGNYAIALTPAAPENLNADFGYNAPTGVYVLNFRGILAESGVMLRWETITPDISLAPDFFIYRSALGAASWTQVTSGPVGPTSLDGSPLAYAYTDLSAQPGITYLYQLVNPQAPDTVYGPYQVKIWQAFLPLIRR